MGTDPSEDLTEAASPLLEADGNSATAGVVIDPYELLRLIGAGGMGQVWLAERKQPMHRRVALVARFESERQALALTDPRDSHGLRCRLHAARECSVCLTVPPIRGWFSADIDSPQGPPMRLGRKRKPVHLKGALSCERNKEI
jgi:serine/threonine protein kinase